MPKTPEEEIIRYETFSKKLENKKEELLNKKELTKRKQEQLKNIRQRVVDTKCISWINNHKVEFDLQKEKAKNIHVDWEKEQKLIKLNKELKLPKNLWKDNIKYENINELEMPTLQQLSSEVITKISNQEQNAYLKLSKNLKTLGLTINEDKVKEIYEQLILAQLQQTNEPLINQEPQPSTSSQVNSHDAMNEYFEQNQQSQEEEQFQFSQ